MLFKLAKLNYDFDKPLTPKILSNPHHPIVKHILYLYSMESFIYSDLNQVCKLKDHSKIKFYGAYAAALSYIIYSSNSNKRSGKLSGATTLCRGVQLLPNDIDSFQPGSKTNLLGYTSTSKSFDKAAHFAFY